MFGSKQLASTSDRIATMPRRIAALHWTAVIISALMIVAAYVVVDRMVQTQRESATAIGLVDRQRMLCQRIASLTSQTVLGDETARRELPAAIDAFARSERVLDIEKFGSNSSSSLHAAIGDFLTRARLVSRMLPRDPGLPDAAAPILRAARKPLLDRLDAAILVRQTQAARDLSKLRRIGTITALTLLGILLADAFGIVGPFTRRATRLARDAAELTRRATIDPLTGTLNRQSFQDRGMVEIAKAKRYNRPLSLLMIDPDQLAAITNTHGPSAGESVLKALTQTLFEGTRVTDLVGRVGGKEFAVLLPETDPAGAELLAERLRRRISDLTVPVKNAIVSCTVSIGVAAAETSTNFFAPTFARADEALYEAQMRGRNRVFVNAA